MVLSNYDLFQQVQKRKSAGNNGGAHPAAPFTLLDIAATHLFSVGLSLLWSYSVSFTLPPCLLFDYFFDTLFKSDSDQERHLTRFES